MWGVSIRAKGKFSATLQSVAGIHCQRQMETGDKAYKLINTQEGNYSSIREITGVCWGLRKKEDQ